MTEVPSDDPSWICMALQAPLHFFGTCGNPKVMKLIRDSGASISITPNKDDFIGEVKPVPTTTHLKGLAKGLKITGMGTVHWNVLDNRGHLCTLKILAYHMPESPTRHLSTTSLLQTYSDETIVIHPGGLVLSGAESDPERALVTI